MQSSAAATLYAESTRSTGTPRGIEYHVFATVTRELSKLKSDEVNRPSQLPVAIHNNLRLWSIIGADVARNGNGLPKELRSKLFYLSEFTRVHSAKVLAGEAKADVLVDINTAVMRGLRGEITAAGA